MINKASFALCPGVCVHTPVIHIPHPNGTSVTADDPALARRHRHVRDLHQGSVLLLYML